MSEICQNVKGPRELKLGALWTLTARLKPCPSLSGSGRSVPRSADGAGSSPDEVFARRGVAMSATVFTYAEFASGIGHYLETTL